MPTTVETVAGSLIEAFNERDIDAALAVLDENVVLDFGPKTLCGRDEARQFIERQLFGVGIRISHGRRFARGDALVAESHQEMSFVETGERAAAEDLVALYLVRGELLTQYREFPSLTAAFDASSVTETDEISPG